MMYSTLLLAVLASGCLALASSRSAGEARIDVERSDVYTVHALFDGTGPEALTYRIEILREGASGQSRTSQSGAFESAAGRTDTLSTSQVNVSPGDRFEARLVVSRGNAVLDSVTVTERVR